MYCRTVWLAACRRGSSARPFRRRPSLSLSVSAAFFERSVAVVLDGFRRKEAARLYGMDRQSLRDWVHSGNHPLIATRDLAQVRT